MKTKDWAWLAGILLLAVLLLRAEFCNPPKTVEVVKWKMIDLDSLKVTMPRDTVFIPGPERQVLRYVTVTVTSQAQADSLAKAYAELANRYQQLETELQWGWLQGEGYPFEFSKPAYTYADSVTTPDYFHRWAISAEGPITAYEYGVLPICPPVPPVPVSQAQKAHRIGAWMGMQAGATVSPVFGISYRNKYFFTTAGYVTGPKAVQVGLGIDIGVK
jgi:hypothetical protein